MISTDTAATSPYARRGSGPNSDQARNASAATSPTSGTNQAETRSASRCAGARLRCARATRSIIRAKAVSRPTRSARMTSAPAPLTAPAISFAPAAFGTGIDSPVINASSTALAPSTATPSAGIFSPGRTRNRSPTAMSSRATSRSTPSGIDSKRPLRRESEKAADGVAGPLARHELQRLPDQHERGDDRSSLEIDRRPGMAISAGRKETRRDRDESAEGPGDADAKGDQGEHVEAAGADGGGGADEERPAGAERDRRRQRQLQPVRDRRREPEVSNDMPGHVVDDERDRQRQGEAEPAPHLGEFRVRPFL